MTKDPEEKIKELLQRIARLETTVESMRVSLEEFLKKFRALELKIQNNGEQLLRLGDIVFADIKNHDDRFDCAFERIKGLEVTVFPNLLKDIESVHRIVGGDGVPGKRNPLDYRKPDIGGPNSA